jgi:gamma-glutamyltranspeptidase/glutathione hydrolase
MTRSRRPARAFALVVAVLVARDAAVPRVARAGPSAEGSHAAVATDQRLATETGIRILRDGGNAIDAAVAIGYTLAVTYPAAGNLGGGGFMLIRFADGRTHFVDFRETAPGAATAGMYLGRNGAIVPDLSIVGPLAAGIPGSVAGLEFARERYGTRSRHDLMHDAIGYAKDGFIPSEGDAEILANARVDLARFPATAAVFERGGTTPRAGTLFKQPDLARTLHAIDERGRAGFYSGDVARRLVRAVRARGGIFTEADLAGYAVVDRDPLVCAHRGETIVTSPPPSSGGVAVCEILGIIGDAAPVPPMRSFENAHLEVEAERRAFADRNMQLGDPAFVPSPVARLLAPNYLARERASIAPERATPSSAITGLDAHEGTNTTNYSVVDAAGNAVDVTYTLNNRFGSDFVAGDTGVLLNDEMDDFTSKPGSPNMFGLVQGVANAIAPGKRPLSSMTPSIVVNAKGNVLLVVGAAGGPRIITSTLDAIRAVVDFGEDAPQALADPRMHMQWLPDVLFAQPTTFDAVTSARLEAAGYRIELGRAGSDANAIGVRPDGTRVGAHDPRGVAGSALGY